MKCKNKLPRRSLIAQTALLLALPAMAPAADASEPAKPNILFVMADQWRAQAFGYAGDPNVKTPNVDRFERESMDCAHAISSVPVCCPARASLWTGQRALTHGVILNDVPLNPNAVTIAKVLDQAGYDTGYIGKWHLNGAARSAYIPPDRRQGFDYWKVLNCTHDYNHSYYYAGDDTNKLLWKGYDAIAQTEDAEQYLKAHARAAKPFFLVLSWGPPHNPYQTAPARYRALYQPDKIQLRPNVPADGRPAAQRAAAGYYAHCTALDDCLGQLLATLKQTGLASNTIVVFTADHGDMLGSHGDYEKEQAYDEASRVPLLWRWPAGLGATGRTLDAFITSEDLMPTLLGLCGVAIPPTVEGKDYSGYLRGGKNPSDGTALISCAAPFGTWDRRQGGREFRALRTERYTYVRGLDGPWLLFDDQADPYQTNNLVNLPEQAGLRVRLDATLQRKLRQDDDQFLPAADYIKKWGYPVNTNGTVPYTN